ncbi:MAG TPA: tetraacyldisaccharide 4'-kinase [Candidatus Acidoferrum sp.]|nr:tetraacyldisaccharide 4'-kinase [Candidatus Acidoferrum sp.]
MNPLSAVYGALVGTRNHLYDRGLLRVRRLSRPVVSVGSISAGGAGKTPFVIFLGELLKQRGIVFDVLSRGYGRKSRGVLVVDSDGPASQFGDEPLLIARRLGCPVIVGESRYEAGILAEQKFQTQIHILDDGFQHRSLARDFDIALLTPQDCDDQLLPGGRLREPLGSLQRADTVVWSGSEEPPVSVKRLWRIRRSVSFSGAPSNPVVFCGIARPQTFLNQLKMAGMAPAAFKSYRDHHSYSVSDVQELLALSDRHQANGFVTTEKDAINLGGRMTQLGTVTIAKVVVDLINPADALDTMLGVIAERGSSSMRESLTGKT